MNLKNHTLTQLRAACKTAGLRGYSKFNKAALIDWIGSHPQSKVLYSQLGDAQRSDCCYLSAPVCIAEGSDPEGSDPGEDAIAEGSDPGGSDPEGSDPGEDAIAEGSDPEGSDPGEDAIAEGSDPEGSDPRDRPLTVDEELIVEQEYQRGCAEMRAHYKLPRVGKKIISFGWTSDQLLAGLKTETRRTWKQNTANYYQRKFEKGIRFFPAWDKAPFLKGKQIGWIELVGPPFQQWLSQISKPELIAEGFPLLGVVEYPLWRARELFINNFFGGKDRLIWALRFKFHKNLPFPASFTPQSTDCSVCGGTGENPDNGLLCPVYLPIIYEEADCNFFLGFKAKPPHAKYPQDIIPWFSSASEVVSNYPGLFFCKWKAIA